MSEETNKDSEVTVPAKFKSLVESIEKMSKLDFDIMLPGHGEVLKANASEAVKEFLESNE